jgi:predicted nucleic acid-binding protein
MCRASCYTRTWWYPHSSNQAAWKTAFFNLALTGRLQLYISTAVIAEYAGVLPRPKFKLSADDVSLIIGKIREAAIMVRPIDTLTISRDESDNRFRRVCSRGRS